MDEDDSSERRISVTAAGRRICEADLEAASAAIGSTSEVVGQRTMQPRGKRGWFTARLDGAALERLGRGGCDGSDTTVKLADKAPAPARAPLAFEAETVVVLYGLTRGASLALPSVVDLLRGLPGGSVIVAHTWCDAGAGPAVVEAAVPGAVVASSRQADYELPALEAYPDHYGDGQARVANQLRGSQSLARAYALAPKPAKVTIFARLDCVYPRPLRPPPRVDRDDCYVPAWGDFGGVNDRFAVCGADAADAYAARGDGLLRQLELGFKGNTEAHLQKHLKGARVHVKALDPWFDFVRARDDLGTPAQDAKRFCPTTVKAPHGHAGAVARVPIVDVLLAEYAGTRRLGNNDELIAALDALDDVAAPLVDPRPPPPELPPASLFNHDLGLDRHQADAEHAYGDLLSPSGPPRGETSRADDEDAFDAAYAAPFHAHAPLPPSPVPEDPDY